jgi:hypothetical protein
MIFDSVPIAIPYKENFLLTVLKLFYNKQMFSPVGLRYRERKIHIFPCEPKGVKEILE